MIIDMIQQNWVIKYMDDQFYYSLYFSQMLEKGKKRMKEIEVVSWLTPSILEAVLTFIIRVAQNLSTSIPVLQRKKKTTTNKNTKLRELTDFPFRSLDLCNYKTLYCNQLSPLFMNMNTVKNHKI